MASAAPAQAATATFSFTGGEQTFTVPAGVNTVYAMAVGGKGGAGPGGAGGFGAVMTAGIAVAPGDVLYIEVGGNGVPFGSCCTAAFNGGGAGGNAATDGGGGGGATDVRTISRSNAGSLGSRVVIAGGGGGGAGAAGGAAGNGGTACQGCAGPGSAGQANAGGPGGSGAPAGDAGQLGAGGSGASTPAIFSSGGGGGGGGLYGGGGGGAGSFGGGGGAGGGGASFAEGGGTLTTDVDGVPEVRLTFTLPASGGGGTTNYPVPPGAITPTAGQTPALGLLSPFPVVRLSGRVTRRGARIRLLSVRAPRNTTIRVRCRGSRCPRRQAKPGRGMRRPVRFPRFHRPLRAGVRLEVSVTRAAVIGKFVRFRIRRGRAPLRRDLCLRPGATRATSCPD